jgi:hypothetical protein
LLGGVSRSSWTALEQAWAGTWRPAVTVARCGAQRPAQAARQVGPLRLNARPFTSVDDLRQVSGIGDRRFEALKDLVTVSGGR